MTSSTPGLVPRLAALAGLIGGLAWIAAWALDRFAGSGVADVLGWLGLVLVLLAAAVGGLALVPTAPAWLRAVAALGAAVLVWAVVATAQESVGSRVVDLLAGVVAVVVAGTALGRVLARTGRE